MKRIRRSMSIAVLVTPLALHALAAQERGESAIAIVTAIRAVRGDFNPGAGKIEFAAHIPLLAPEREQVTRSLGMTLGELSKSRVCTAPSPSACSLVGVVVFVSVTQASISGDSAEVTLEVLEQTPNRRQPIHGSALSVRLARQGPGQWKAVAVRPIWES